MALLEVNDLCTYFHTRGGIVKAVDGISFSVERGQTLGIVGESGSGKSVANYTLLGLIPTPPGRVESGQALFDGRDLLQMKSKELRTLRGRRISMIFQDPMTCLNPYLRVSTQLEEPLRTHFKISREEAHSRAIRALEEVGIQDAKNRVNHYPHEFSGGMRQRVMIAMALITEPELLIADEPTTALDVTVQAQILELIKKLQDEKGTSIIFITHDLGVIAGLADQVIVMYAGKAVEKGPTAEIFQNPGHPYTRALLQSIPGAQAPGAELYSIPGLPPDVSQTIEGCAFASRCESAQVSCKERTPQIQQIRPNHESACLRVQDGSLNFSRKTNG